MIKEERAQKEEEIYTDYPDIPDSQYFDEFTEKKKEENGIKILKDPKLIENILREVSKKVIGEEKTVLTLFLCCCGIWVKNLKSMLNCFVNAQSSAGKDFVTKAVYDLFPSDMKEHRTKITPEAFSYWHNSKYELDWTWDGKICYLSDIRNKVLNAEAFKVMCSEGSISTVVKDQRAIDIIIKGKPIIIVTTATANPKAEILNRFISITLDETKKQTIDIMEKQAKEAEEGKTEQYNLEFLDCLKQLKRVNVKIPYASKIYRCFAANNIVMRRYFKTALDLIRCSAALHQCQRKQDKDGFIIAESRDYELMRYVMSKIQLQKPQLTHRLQKAYDTLATYCGTEFKLTAKELYQKNPFCSERMWYNYLQKLCEIGIVKFELEERATSNKPVACYYPILLDASELPEFNKL